VRREAQEKLRESEARFRTMADSSPIMIWLTDPQGNTLFLNRAYLEYCGVAADEATTYDWPKIVHPDDRDVYVAAFKTALENRRTFHQRVRLRRFDGQWRWFESRGNPIVDATGHMTGYIGSSPDITDIYESQQRLRELDQRKDEFLANMSHEIRSPLAGIMGYAELLLTKLKDPEEIECLKTIKESGDYLIEIVNDILDLSKIEAGKLVLNVEAVSPHAVLGEIHGLMDVRAREKRLPLVLRYDGVLPVTIHTDRTRLRQIVINLVSNAIKFTERGRVEIVAQFLKDVDLLQVEVIDTGIGIAAEHQARLFEPFTQSDSTSTRRYGGTGLGLTITRRLVEMLGGGISFESEPDKGSTFRVTIPTAPGQPASMPVHTTLRVDAAISELPLRDLHVLVVDDRAEFCYLVSKYIKDAGGRPEAAGDGETAIEAVEAAAKTDPFHAIVMDIQMPGIDGYETTRRIRAKGFQTPVIALTAAAMVGDREKCLQAGCDDYLTKPIDRSKLVHLVGLHAQKARREDRQIDGTRLSISASDG
jgi:PAS domain S-box-containing protein